MPLPAVIEWPTGAELVGVVQKAAAGLFVPSPAAICLHAVLRGPARSLRVRHLAAQLHRIRRCTLKR
jgi:hypothetical protein